MKKYILLLVSAIIIVACQEKKVFMKDVAFTSNGDIVFYQGEPFTGEMWSDDGRFMKLTVEQGNPQKMELFHSNGKVAYLQFRDADEHKQEIFTDENGKQISSAEFDEKYADILIRLEEIGEEVERRSN